MLGGNWAKQNARFYYYDSETMQNTPSLSCDTSSFLAVNEAILGNYDVDTNGGRWFSFKGET